MIVALDKPNQHVRPGVLISVNGTVYRVTARTIVEATPVPYVFTGEDAELVIKLKRVRRNSHGGGQR